MSNDFGQPKESPVRGQFLFALGFFAFSALLLTQIGEQTRWTSGTKLFAQPRFWPAIGLGGMVLLGGLHMLRLPLKRITSADAREAGLWITGFEWVGWFLVYVTLVPIVGYLPVTLVFAVILAKRVGYRGMRWTLVAAGFGLAVVLLFKTFMGVKIPGAILYDHLPSALRSFFIVNF